MDAVIGGAVAASTLTTTTIITTTTHNPPTNNTPHLFQRDPPFRTQAVHTTRSALSVLNVPRFCDGFAVGVAETTATRLIRDVLLAATTGAMTIARCMMPMLDKLS